MIRDEPEARKSLRRRVGDRRRAVLVGGSVATFIVLGGIHSPLVDAGVVETPYMISFAFLTFVLALSYELVSDAVLATRYAKEIRASETHWRSLLTKVQLAVISIDPKGRITSQLRRSSTPWYLVPGPKVHLNLFLYK